MAVHLRPVFARNSILPTDVEGLEVRAIEVVGRQSEASDGEAESAQSEQFRVEARVELAPESNSLFTAAAVATIGARASIECRLLIMVRFLIQPSHEVAGHPRSLEVIRRMAWPAIVRVAQQAAVAVTGTHHVLGPAASRRKGNPLLRRVLRPDPARPAGVRR